MKGFAGGFKDQLSAKIEALDTQLADLLRENAELKRRVKTLEDALTKIAGYFDVPDWVKRKALEALTAKEPKA